MELNPSYKIPTIKTMKKKMKTIYEEKKAEIIKNL